MSQFQDMEEQRRENFSELSESTLSFTGNRNTVAKKLVIKNLKIKPKLPHDFQVGLEVLKEGLIIYA